MKKNLIKLTLAFTTLTLFASCSEHCNIEEPIVAVNKYKGIKKIIERYYIPNNVDTTHLHTLYFDTEGNIIKQDHDDYEINYNYNKNKREINIVFKSKSDHYKSSDGEKIKLILDEKGKFRQKIYTNNDQSKTDTLDYEYDNNGLLIKVEYRRSKDKAILKYDNKNRVIERKDYDDTRLVYDWSYEYDNKGRINKLFLNEDVVNKSESIFEMEYNNPSKTNPINYLFKNSNKYLLDVNGVELYNLSDDLIYISSNVHYTGGVTSTNLYIPTGEEKERIWREKKTGKILCRDTFEFDFDENGIWTKLNTTEYLGTSKSTRIHFREIEYYN